MGNPWFRLYGAELLNDPKAQRLSAELFKTWINVLCAASGNSGLIPPLTDLAFMLRRDEISVGDDMDALISAGLVDDVDGVYAPHNWGKRQFQSDNSTARVRRFRDGKEANKRNVSETVNETPPEQNRADSEQIQISHPTDAPPNSDEVTLAVEAYNAACPETGWPVVQRITAPRKAALRSRLRECGGISGWLAAIDKGKASDFLCGRNNKQWLADFDFFCQAKSFTKLMEGSYDNRTPNNDKSNSKSVFGALAEIVATGIRAGGTETGPPARPVAQGHGSDPLAHSGPEIEASAIRIVA